MRRIQTTNHPRLAVRLALAKGNGDRMNQTTTTTETETTTAMYQNMLRAIDELITAHATMRRVDYNAAFFQLRQDRPELFHSLYKLRRMAERDK